jgi:hypothetical protein
MKAQKSHPRPILTLALAVAACALAGAAFAAEMHGPHIDGTYILVSRVLPDGTTMRPPDVIGEMSLHHGWRNFNVYWHDASGKRISISLISQFTLTSKKFTETNVFDLVNDEIHGKGLTYDVSSTQASSPVTVKGGEVHFQFPLHGEPAVVFTNDGMTASQPGVFVDHWKKVR